MRDPDRYTYYEYGSNSHSGGVADKSHGNIVNIVETAPHVSHVEILDVYLPKIPPEMKPSDQFYLQPLPFTLTGNMPWYWASPLGKNKLQWSSICFVKQYIEGYFTNHSPRAINSFIIIFHSWPSFFKFICAVKTVQIAEPHLVIIVILPYNDAAYTNLQLMYKFAVLYCQAHTQRFPKKAA